VEVFVQKVLYRCFQYSVSELHFSFRAVVGSLYGVFILSFHFMVLFFLVILLLCCFGIVSRHVFDNFCSVAWSVVI
jgi:uncharacterized membrane protein